ncbi:MAG: Ig-like domain repeat protein [Phycisphaerae bacterium]
MKTYLKIATIFLTFGLSVGWALGQTANATALMTVEGPKAAATGTLSPSTLAIHEGTTAVFTAKVTGSSTVTPTGTVKLYSRAPTTGAVYTLLNTFSLVSGSATCDYPIPATAPTGGYYLTAVYSADSNYLAGTAP